MPQPDTVTPDDIARWDLLLSQSDAITRNAFRPDVLREMIWYPSSWLFEQLRTENCPDALGQRIQHFASLEMIGKRDTWAVVAQILDDYRRGAWDEPGLELAERLFQKREG